MFKNGIKTYLNQWQKWVITSWIADIDAPVSSGYHSRGLLPEDTTIQWPGQILEWWRWRPTSLLTIILKWTIVLLLLAITVTWGVLIVLAKTGIWTITLPFAVISYLLWATRFSETEEA